MPPATARLTLEAADTSALPKAIEIPPSTRRRSRPMPTGSVTTLIVPPSESEPYWAPLGPCTTSTRSANDGSISAVYWFAPGRNVALLKRTPSTRATTCWPVRPRTNGEPWLVVVCCTCTPASPASARGKMAVSRLPISEAAVTVTNCGVFRISWAVPRSGVTVTKAVTPPTPRVTSAVALSIAATTTVRRCSAKPAFDTTRT